MVYLSVHVEIPLGCYDMSDSEMSQNGTPRLPRSSWVACGDRYKSIDSLVIHDTWACFPGGDNGLLHKSKG